MFILLEDYIRMMEVGASAKILLNLGVYLLKIAAIVVIGLIAMSIVRRLIKRLSTTWRDHGSDRKADTLSVVLLSLSRYAIGFVVVCAVLGVFDVPIQSILAVAGIGSVAIGFGAQGLVKDFITGFFILLEDQFGVGDLVTLAGKTGTVESIGMRTTRIRSFDGDVHIFPNSQIQFVTNSSSSFRRAIVDVSLSYNNDLDKSLRSLCEEMRLAKDKVKTLVAEPAVIVITEPKDGAMSIRIVAECQVGETTAVAHEIKQMIGRRFADEKIECVLK